MYWPGIRRDPCSRVRRALDDWLDSASVSPVPVHASEHMRACQGCRQYVSMWNAIELRLRALSDEWPSRAELASAVRSQPAWADADVRRANSGPGIPAWRLTVAAAGVVALAAALVYMLTPLSGPRVIARQAGAPSIQAQTADTLQRDLPVAATR